jgi:hypothetical protein
MTGKTIPLLAAHTAMEKLDRVVHSRNQEARWMRRCSLQEKLQIRQGTHGTVHGAIASGYSAASEILQSGGTTTKAWPPAAFI